MMPLLTIDTRQLKGVAEVMKAMPKQAPGIIKRTINWTGNKARTQVFRALAQTTGFKYGEISDKVETIPATDTSLAYRLHATGEHTTLARFNPRQTSRGVTARPWGQMQTFRGAFIVPSLPPLAFHRYGPKMQWGTVRSMRQKIEPLYGPALPKEMMKPVVEAAATFSIGMDFAPRLDHEFKRALLGEMKKHIVASGFRP